MSQTWLESRLLNINCFKIVIPNRECKGNLATQLLKKPCVGVRQLPHLLRVEGFFVGSQNARSVKNPVKVKQIFIFDRVIIFIYFFYI